MRAKSNRVREGNGRRFQGRRKGKEKSFCFVDYLLISNESTARNTTTNNNPFDNDDFLNNEN